MTVAQLGLAVDSKQASQAAVDLDKLTASAAKADATASTLAAGSKRAEAAAGQLAASVRSAGTAADSATAAMQRNAAAITLDGTAAGTATAQMHRYTQAMNDNVKVSRDLAFQRRNLSFQLIDTAQSLALGMPAYMVALQQGPQIAQIWGASEGGVARAFAESAAMVGRFAVALAPLAAVAGVAALGFAGLTREINQAGRIQVSFWNTIVATAEVSVEAILAALDPLWTGIQNGFGAVWDFIQPTLKIIGNAMIASFVGAFEHIKFLFGNNGEGLGNIIAAGVIGGANLAIDGINALIAAATEGINEVIRLANQIPGVDIGEIGTAPAIQRIDNPAFRAAQIQTDQRDRNIAEAFSTDYLGDAFDSIATRAREVSQRSGDKKKTGRQRVDEYERNVLSIQKQTEALEIQARVFGLSERAAAEFQVRQELINSAFRAGKELTPELMESIEALASSYGEATEKLEQLQARQDAIDGLSQSVYSAFSGMTTGATTFSEAIDDLTDSLIQMILQATLLGQGPLAGLFGTGGGGGGLLGSIIGAFIPQANANGNAFYGGNVIPFARGGIVDRPATFPIAGGQTGLMGEAGPEAIMPLRRLPNGRLGVEAGGGGSVSVPIEVSIDARGADPAGLARVEQQVALLRREIPGLAVKGLQEARLRGARV